MKPHTLCLGSISLGSPVDNIKNWTKNETVDISDIKNSHKYLMKKTIAQVLVLLSFGRSLATTCVSINNRLSMVRPIYQTYPFIISLDRCDGICNTAEDPFDRPCV